MHVRMGRFDFSSDCVLTDWTDWDACAAPCDGLTVRSRLRSVVRHPVGGGAECGDIVEVAQCVCGIWRADRDCPNTGGRVACTCWHYCVLLPP